MPSRLHTYTAPPFSTTSPPLYRHDHLRYHLDVSTNSPHNNSSQTEEPPQDSYIRELEARFSRGIFHGVFPEHTIGRKSQARFTWPEDVTVEQKLKVIFNCMFVAGFSGLGAFLYSLFQRDVHFQNQSVSQTISHFLSGKSLICSERPLSIVKLIYEHPKSQIHHDRIPEQPNFAVPRYAMPPSSRPSTSLEPAKENSTRNSILDWAVQRVVEHVDREAELLTTLEGISKGSREKITWDRVMNWSMTHNQETFARKAPVLFLLITTVAVSQRQRRKLEAKSVAASKDDDDSDKSSDEDVGMPWMQRLLAESKRDPWMGSTVAISILLYFRYRYASLFAIMIGVFLFSCNANREIFTFTSRIGLSVAYSTTLTTLRTLADDSAMFLKGLGAALEHGPPNFLLLFDNVNKNRRAWQQSLLDQDVMNSGTAATLVLLENLLPGALDMTRVLANRRSKARSALTVTKLLDDIDWKHIDKIGSATVVRTWIRSVPSLAHFRSDIETHFSTSLARHRLQTRKSRIYSMRTTNIDESTSIGANDVLRNLIFDQLNISAHWLKSFVLFCGDQLSIDRLRKLMRYTAKGDTPSSNYNWVLPVIQLWHLKYNWQKTVIQGHWWDESGRGVYGLAHDARHIRREKFNPTKCDFYPAHHLLEDRFDAMVLHALRLICEEKSEIVTPKSIPLIDGLDTYFKPDGLMSSTSFEQLLTFGDIVNRRYMVNAAYEDALGHIERDIEVYGSPADMSMPSNDVSQPIQIGSKSKKKSKRSKAATAETRNISSGDQCLANDISFLRTTMWYLEICAAIAEGDIGRVFEVIKILRFSFWGTGSTNYGNEMLELACNFIYEFTPELVTAIFENYLVNTSNLEGHWFELDLLQEHFNFWIKRLFNSKSHDFDSRHLAECVSLNIQGLSALRAWTCSEGIWFK
ncbi:hypothetical protein FB446DRAFT_655696 [Lentinula raphanica]|nr:hypothetical protein FB446DRAFT_655696 [Lentinula raphanica]